MGCAPCAGGGAGEEDKFKCLESRWDISTEPIGEGGFGSVHLAKNRKTGKTRALKAMRLKEPEEWQDFHNEILIMTRIKRHHNICHILDSADDKKFGYIVMQACSGGELFDRITQKGLSEREAALAVVDVLSAVRYIHAKRIIHRDLKPENLLYKDKDPGAPLKVIDFGLAVLVEPKHMVDECCGTTSYMAPEVLTGPYDVQCDLWSVGVIVYFMMCGYLPFMGRNDEEKESKILRGAYSFKDNSWNLVSSEAKDFISKLLVQNPKARMTGKQALQHPWIVKRANLSNEPLGEEITKGLKAYAANNRFERAVRHKMATNLTTAELQHWRNKFEELDKEDTGEIPIAEMHKVLKEGAGDGEDLSKMLAELDIDGDGTIDWKEFVAACLEEHTLYNEENLEKVFTSLDTNKSGGLCHKEIAELLGHDHELSKEVMEKLKASRGTDGPSIDSVHMTLKEFKDLLIDRGTLGGKTKTHKAHKTKTRRSKGEGADGAVKV